VVLLRNEPVAGAPVLPISRTAGVAVLGRLAGEVNVGDSGSSDVWDLECRTVADGLRAAVPGVIVEPVDDPGVAARVAAQADVAIVVVGNTRLDEGEYMGDLASLADLLPPADEPEIVARFEAWKPSIPPVTRPERLEAHEISFETGGDRRSLRLHPGHVELIRAVAGVNPRTVVVIQSGSAVVCSEWVDAVPAVVQGWYGGAEAGPALADILTGAAEPSGRLPFTIPEREADLPAFDSGATSFRYDRWHGWWHLARTGRQAAFPFGFGLGYTTFEFSDVAVTLEDASIVARGLVVNTGNRPGSDVVQVYAHREGADAPARLVGFTRVEVATGDAVPFELEVPVDLLATRDPVAHTWQPARGPHRIAVARHAGDARATEVRLDL